MATFEWTGLDNYTKQWGEMSENIGKINDEALYVGAEIIADAIRAEIPNIPSSCLLNERERDDLQKSLYIKNFEHKDGGVLTHISFGGYNNWDWKKYSESGIPALLIARSICAGSSLRKGKCDFVTQALKGCKDKVETEMNKVINDRLEQIQNK